MKQRSTASAGLFWATLSSGCCADVGEPLVDHLERFGGDVALRVGTDEPDHLVGGIAVVVEHPPPRDEGLVAVVHVQLFLEVVALVDQRDVDVAIEVEPVLVRGVHRGDVAFTARRRRHAAVRREPHVA